MRNAILIAVAMLMFINVGFTQRDMRVLADVSLTSQTGNNSGTLYTPTSTGFFRITFYVRCKGGVQNCPILSQGSAALTYTADGDGGSIGIPMPSQSGWIGMIKADANTPIHWVLFSFPGDTSVYDLYILAEQPGPQPTQIVLTPSVNPSVVNQTVVLTAVVTGQNGETPTGSVTFTINFNKPVTVPLVNGQAIFNWTFLFSGPRTVIASYSGDNDNKPSVSAILNQTVTP